MNNTQTIQTLQRKEDEQQETWINCIFIKHSSFYSHSQWGHLIEAQNIHLGLKAEAGRIKYRHLPSYSRRVHCSKDTTERP